jgi:preprotein translocase subunit SecY
MTDGETAEEQEEERREHSWLTRSFQVVLGGGLFAACWVATSALFSSHPRIPDTATAPSIQALVALSLFLGVLVTLLFGEPRRGFERPQEANDD